MFRLLRGLSRVLRCSLCHIHAGCVGCAVYMLIVDYCVSYTCYVLDSIPSDCSWFGPHMIDCRIYMLVGRYPICYGVASCGH